MEATPPESTDDQELSAAFDKLRIVVAWREKEHETRWKQGVWIGRGSALALGGVFIAMMVLSLTFDQQTYTKLMQSKVNENAPGIIRLGQQSVEGLGPVYASETEKTIPTFEKSLADDAAMEAGQLTDAMKPLVLGDPSSYTTASDIAMAKALQAKFKKELEGEPDKKASPSSVVPNPTPAALALAKALRARQIADAARNPDNPLAGPFGVLRRMQMSLAAMGSSKNDVVPEKQANEEISQAALDRSNGRGPPPEPAEKTPAAPKGGK